MMGMLGTFFNDLVQIGEIENIPGLHTLKDTDFLFEESDNVDSKKLGKFSAAKLSNALKALGVDKTPLNILLYSMENLKTAMTI